MSGRFPNLLLIGAMKSGTTSLHDYLNQHPDIYMSNPKEIHYYSDRGYAKWTSEDYKKFFNSDKKIVGTSPQSYTKCHNKHYQNIPERIYKDTPEVKLIYIVRDPIERYQSDIFESYYCDPMVEIKYNLETDGYIKTSMYGMQLKAFLRYFNMDQIHILSLEDLKSNPLHEMNKIFTFLGLSNMQEESHFMEVKNAAETKDIPRLVKDMLVFRGLSKINSEISNVFARRYAKMFHAEKLVKPILDKDERLKLKKILEKDINEFRQLTNKSFRNWSV